MTNVVVSAEEISCSVEMNVTQAIHILRNELLQHGEVYDAFRASVESAIKDIEDEMYPEQPDRVVLATEIMKRVVGEES